MRHLFCWTATITAMWCGCGVLAQGPSPVDFKARLVAEWATVLGRISTAYWEKKTEYFVRDAAKSGYTLVGIDVTRHGYRRDMGSFWNVKSERANLDKSSQKKNSRHYVELINSCYLARLKKKKGSDGWLLTEIEKNRQEAIAALGVEPCPWMEFGNFDVYEWLKENSFVFSRIEQRQSEPPGSIVRAYFTYSGTPGKAWEAIKSGHIDFDLDNSYRPIAYHFNMKADFLEGHHSGVLEYEDGGGIPVLRIKTLEADSRMPKRGIRDTSKEICTFTTSRINGAVPEEEFRLPYYGFPEPDGVVWPKPRPWYLWFMAIAAASLLIGWYARRRVLQRQALAAPKPRPAKA